MMRLDNPDFLAGLDDFAAELERMAREVRAARNFSSANDPLRALPHILAMAQSLTRVVHHSAALENTVALMRAEFEREGATTQ